MWENIFKKSELICGICYGKTNNLQLSNKFTNKIKLFYGDQSDHDFLNTIKKSLNGKKFNIIIDDGSHVPWHQLFTFEILFETLLEEDGIYIIEDIETSYWNAVDKTPTIYGTYYIENAGIGKNGSLVEQIKNIPDVINRSF
jgi:hypothetical protein